jgi:3-deoxy-D-manno-octulosonic-acid transferase
MTLGLHLYKLMTFLIAPFLGAFFRRRAKAGKEDASRIDERFARNLIARPDGPLIWFHAASVGESQLQLELARRLINQGKDGFTFLLTCQTMTASGLIRDTLREDERFRNRTDLQQMAPVDTAAAIKRFIDHWSPDLVIFAEGEIWPNLLMDLQRRDVPAALVNARMTEKSILGWMRWKRTSRRLFQSYHTLIAADLQTKTGLEDLSGNHVLCPGNLKSALPSPGVDAQELDSLKQKIGERPVLLAASTHASEEAFIIDAFMQIEPKPFLIIAPRHPERGDDVDALLSCTKLAVARRSVDDALTSETDVLLADTIGEMGLWYRLADTVYLGGGHAPGIGGHNPLEALRLCKPVMTGPSLFNFSDLSDRLATQSGFTIVEDAEAFLAQYPPEPVSQDMLDMLHRDAIGPISATLDALAPLVERAGQTE